MGNMYYYGVVTQNVNRRDANGRHLPHTGVSAQFNFEDTLCVKSKLVCNQTSNRPTDCYIMRETKALEQVANTLFPAAKREDSTRGIYNAM